MNARFPTIVSRLPAAWVTVYTTGLAPVLREERRAEIASDTYEHLHDPDLASSPYTLAVDVLQSVARGVPEDLRWRAAHMSAAGTFVQSMIGAVPFGAVAGWVTYHATGNAVLGGLAGGVAGLVVTGLLLAVSRQEEKNLTTHSTAGQRPAGIDMYLTSAALLLFPALVLAAMLIIPMAGQSDPAGDEANLTERAGETARWVGGFSLMALGWGFGMLGVAGLGGIVRRAGATALGTAAPVLFAIGAIGVIAGGHGAVGLGLGATVDSGGNGVTYLETDAQMGVLYSWLGGIVAGLGLLTTAAGIWRTQLLSGWQLGVSVGCLGVAAVVFGMLTGHGVNLFATVAPATALAGFGLVVWRLNAPVEPSFPATVQQAA